MNHAAKHGIGTLLSGMADAEASDLHLVAGNRPMYRIHGGLSQAREEIVGESEVRAMIEDISPPQVAAKLEGPVDFDFAIQIGRGAGARRFRVNVFATRGSLGACFRAIPNVIPILPELGFPTDLGKRLVAQKNGLILLTGITGAGKTTSLAALIQRINAAGGRRIITIEEPIEYVYPPSAASIVTQREVGVDVPSFYEGLRSGLRQDPDVILVGEIRDRETAQLALSAAETGHVIFATLHTPDAKGAITRLVDLFPTGRQGEIRTQLSMSLRFVVAQHLLPSATGGRRVLAMEVLVANFAVRSAIRQGKVETLDSTLQSGGDDGMFSLDSNLRRLLSEEKITLETARAFALDPEEYQA